jgi:tRNA(Ile)-lysidine synthetase-like protein
MTRLAGDARDIEAIHIEAARSLLDKPAGKRVSLPHGLACYGDYDELAITRLLSLPTSDCSVIASPDEIGTRQSQFPPSPFPPLSGMSLLNVPGETFFSGWKVTATITRERPEEVRNCLVAHFDFNKTGADLFVRPRRAGDRFQPLGMSSPKKLYEFMVDAKIPRSWRDRIPIVCSPEQVVWVMGWRMDDRVKLTEASREILRLEFMRSPEQSTRLSLRKAPLRKDDEPRQVGAGNDADSRQTPLVETVDSELRLRRLTVEEALWRLDEYLYAAFMAGLSTVRIVHGKGTGTLRYAVHESLAKNPLVKSYRLGGRGEGGYGVTVVDLTNR